MYAGMEEYVVLIIFGTFGEVCLFGLWVFRRLALLNVLVLVKLQYRYLLKYIQYLFTQIE